MDIYIEKELYSEGVKFINSLMDTQLPEFRGPMSKNIEYRFRNGFVYSLDIKEYSMVEFISLLDRLCYKTKGVLTERVKSYLFRVLDSEEMDIVEKYCSTISIYANTHSYTEFVESICDSLIVEEDYLGQNTDDNTPYNLRKSTLNLFKHVYSSLKSKGRLNFFGENFPKLLNESANSLLLAKSIVLTIPLENQRDSVILELNSDACEDIFFTREDMIYIPSYRIDLLNSALLEESVGCLDEIKLTKEFKEMLFQYKKGTGSIDGFLLYLSRTLQDSKYSMKEASYIKYLANKELSEAYSTLVGGF